MSSLPSLFDLTTPFTTLSLQSTTVTASTTAANSTKITQFHLYPALPIELRLKIISHALPLPTTLFLAGDILVSDPSFGLYLIFRLLPPKRAVSIDTTRTLGAGSEREEWSWFKRERCLHLLGVTQEIRGFYIEKFPHTLPYGSLPYTTPLGKIHFSPHDNLNILNLQSLINAPRVQNALTQNFRLQDFFSQIEEIEVKVQVANTGFLENTVKVLGRFERLRVVRVWLWSGFGDDVREDVKVQFRRSMVARVDRLEEELRRWKEGKLVGSVRIENEGVEDGDEGGNSERGTVKVVKMPRFELIP